MALVHKVNVAEKFGRFQEYWKPKIIGELNDSYIKAVKLKGEFVWHEHEREDELFFVTKGRLVIKLRDGEVELGPGEFVIVPCGVDHLPLASDEVYALLIEAKTTVNTGAVSSDRTVVELDRI